MNKELFIQFIEILDRRAEQVENNKEYKYSEEDSSILQQLTALIEQDPNVKNLLYDIGAASSKEERYQKVENYFSEKSKKKSVDELIAETLDADVSKIDHRYLQNGHEILSFYSSKLDRNLFLKIDSDGKNVKEYLEDLQKKSEEHQGEKAENTLMNERNNNDIELKWYEKKDFAYLYEIADGMTDKDDLQKFKYLLEQLASGQVSCINLDEFVYLDHQNHIGEVSLKNGEIMNMSPADEKSEAASYDIGEDAYPSSEEIPEDPDQVEDEAEKESPQENELPQEETSSKEVEGMLESEEEIKEDGLVKEKPAVYTYHSDNRSTNSDGYGTIVVFAVAIAVFVIGVILYLVFH